MHACLSACLPACMHVCRYVYGCLWHHACVSQRVVLAVLDPSRAELVAESYEENHEASTTAGVSIGRKDYPVLVQAFCSFAIPVSWLRLSLLVPQCQLEVAVARLSVLLPLLKCLGSSSKTDILDPEPQTLTTIVEQAAVQGNVPHVSIFPVHQASGLRCQLCLFDSAHCSAVAASA